ncbi:MAG: hydantoinase/oxoprolinase family protein [Devosia sp.]
MSEPVRIGIDIGGTFTDVALEKGSARFTTKTLTTHAAPEDGVLTGLKTVIEEADVAPSEVALVIHGTTLATNALIERKGAKTALLTTEGFRDVLQIRAEDRFEQYDLTIEPPEPLVTRALRIPVPERVDVNGTIRRPLDEAAVARAAEHIAEAGVEAVAVGFLHSYAAPAHEERAREILQKHLPGVSITLSGEVAPEMREYERFSTAVANAYVQPLMAGYLDRLERRLAEAGVAAPLLLMLSSGGLTTVETAKRFPVRLVESGPAGGAAFAADIARRHGLDTVLSFDMGGTTAKLCLVDRATPRTSRAFEVARVWRFRKGSGLPLRIPVIEMVEIGAGGGSLAGVDELGRITVGPQSAGSEPGPAAYGRGGTGATVTDADVVVGRIDPATFAGGTMPLDDAAAGTALDTAVGTPLGLGTIHAALGVSEMVEETMASAARAHAVEEGTEVEGRAMIAFGGAAPLHALAMADKLGIDRVLVPEGAGVGSAIGFLRAPVAYEVVRGGRASLAEFDGAHVEAILSRGEAEARAIVEGAAPDAPLTVSRKASMRYQGQGHEIEVMLPDGSAQDEGFRERLQNAFETAYRGVYERLVPDGVPECLTFSVNVATAADREDTMLGATETAAEAAPVGERAIVDPATGEAMSVPVFDRTRLQTGAHINGPAVIVEDETTIVLPAAFRATVCADGTIDCRRKEN